MSTAIDQTGQLESINLLKAGFPDRAMVTADETWWRQTKGRPLSATWSMTIDSKLVGFSLAREVGDVYAADASGGVYRINPKGKVIHLTNVGYSVNQIAWSDSGDGGGVILCDDCRVSWLTTRLETAWSRTLPEPILKMAVTPYGSHVAVALSNSHNAIIDARNNVISKFESLRPLKFMQFLGTSSSLVVAADYGLFGKYRLDGSVDWTDKLWTTVGDFCATGDGKYLYIAAFMQGVQVYDSEGSVRGSLVLDGAAARVACSYNKGTIATVTLENVLILMTQDGSVVSAVPIPPGLVSLAIDPVGKWLILGFESGQIVRLDQVDLV